MIHTTTVTYTSLTIIIGDCKLHKQLKTTLIFYQLWLKPAKLHEVFFITLHSCHTKGSQEKVIIIEAPTMTSLIDKIKSSSIWFKKATIVLNRSELGSVVFKFTVMTKHTHYFYSFGELFCRRNVEEFSNIKQAKCRNTKDELFVGGSSNFCLFFVKQEIQYAALKPSQYQTPRVTKCNDQLVSSKTFVTEQMFNKVFRFTVTWRQRRRKDQAQRG